MKAIGAVLVVLLLLCGVVAGLGWYGYTKAKDGDLSFLSKLSFLNKDANTDLGITFTEKEAQEFFGTIETEAKVVTAESPECATLKCTKGMPVFVGTQKVTTTLSNSQGTAVINEWIRFSPNAPFTSAQMRVNANGSVDFAGIVDMKQVQRFGAATNVPAETINIITKYVGSLGGTFPLKASGTLTVKNNAVSANFSSVSVGIIPVPGTLMSQYKGEVNSFLEDRLAVVKGLSIEELSFADGKTTFKGTVPKQVYFVK